MAETLQSSPWLYVSTFPGYSKFTVVVPPEYLKRRTESLWAEVRNHQSSFIAKIDLRPPNHYNSFRWHGSKEINDPSNWPPSEFNAELYSYSSQASCAKECIAATEAEPHIITDGEGNQMELRNFGAQRKREERTSLGL